MFDSSSATRPKLPRRDLVLIPLLSVLTCAALFAAAEVGAARYWVGGGSDARVVSDPVLGHRYKPNCTTRVKSTEGPWVTYSYNECGYRTDQGCGPRPAGVRRIDLMGSSVAQGYFVPYEGSIGATLQSNLSQRCHAPVQVENMASLGYEGDIIAAQMHEAEALKPDAIVFLVTPFDFDGSDKQDAAEAPAGQPELLRRVKNFISSSHAVQLAQHFVFADNARFGALYLAYGDRADFLRSPLTPAWRQRLARLDGLLGRMEAATAASGTPVVLAYVPSRAQAIYLSDKQRPPEIDPLAFGRAVGELAAAHGMTYADMSETLADVTDAGSLYYPVDGHIAAAGDVLVGRGIASRLTASVAPFQGCSGPTQARATP